MRMDELEINNYYFLIDKAVYRYNLRSNFDNITLDYKDEFLSYVPVVELLEIYEKPLAVFIDGGWFNIKCDLDGAIIYTNSFFLSKTNPKDKKQQTNNYTTNISEYIDDRLDAVNKDLVNRYDGYFIGVDFSSDLDVVEIRNGKANFKKKPTEEDIKKEFTRARREENKIYPDEAYIEPQADWIKEFIHMDIAKKIDDALKSGNREEFIRLSEKLKEMGKYDE